MSYFEIVNKVSKELNLPEEVVDRSYKAFWLFVRETAASLPLKEISSEEEFSKLRVNFNIPSLGKLYCKYGRVQALNKKYKNKGEDA